MSKRKPLPKLPRVNMWVRYRRGRKDWVIKLGTYELDSGKYKEPTVTKARRLAREHFKSHNEVVELHVCNLLGEVGEKNTYPRRYDNSKIKG